MRVCGGCGSRRGDITDLPDFGPGVIRLLAGQRSDTLRCRLRYCSHGRLQQSHRRLLQRDREVRSQPPLDGGPREWPRSGVPVVPSGSAALGLRRTAGSRRQLACRHGIFHSGNVTLLYPIDSPTVKTGTNHEVHRSSIVYQGSTTDERQDLHCYCDRNGHLCRARYCKRHQPGCGDGCRGWSRYRRYRWRSRGRCHRRRGRARRRRGYRSSAAAGRNLCATAAGSRRYRRAAGADRRRSSAAADRGSDARS